jgi:hypothetical protein
MEIAELSTFQKSLIYLCLRLKDYPVAPADTYISGSQVSENGYSKGLRNVGSTAYIYAVLSLRIRIHIHI